MTGLMFEKPHKHKKRKRHKASILHCKDGTCYLCMRLDDVYARQRGIQEHHVFGGPNRAISEAEGLKVYLCLKHHTAGPQAVHVNAKIMRILQQDAQRAYEKTHSRQEFMDLIGRNYLEEEDDG